MSDKPLDDKRLEAAANIFLLGSIFPKIKYARSFVVGHQDIVPSIISTAIKQTHADKLAEALERCIPILENLDTIRHIAPDFPALDNARAALDTFKEIANG